MRLLLEPLLVRGRHVRCVVHRLEPGVGAWQFEAGDVVPEIVARDDFGGVEPRTQAAQDRDVVIETVFHLACKVGGDGVEALLGGTRDFLAGGHAERDRQARAGDEDHQRQSELALSDERPRSHAPHSLELSRETATRDRCADSRGPQELATVGEWRWLVYEFA